MLDPGETVKCTFTNIQRGTITIIKDAQPNDAQNFGFTSTASGLSFFDLDDDDNGTLSNMPSRSRTCRPATTRSPRTAVDGWDLTDLECTALGEARPPCRTARPPTCT